LAIRINIRLYFSNLGYTIKLSYEEIINSVTFMEFIDVSLTVEDGKIEVYVGGKVVMVVQGVLV